MAGVNMNCEICDKELIKGDKIIIVGEYKVTGENNCTAIKDIDSICEKCWKQILTDFIKRIFVTEIQVNNRESITQAMLDYYSIGVKYEPQHTD